MNWKCKSTWKKAKKNTLWCLLGCSIGDFGTILYFQNIEHSWSNFEVMGLAIVNGLITSVILETIILSFQISLKKAFQTAIGMSFISMISMEVAMNLVDYLMTGGAKVNLQVIPFMLIAGFITPWPYNYWRLKKIGKGCCG